MGSAIASRIKTAQEFEDPIPKPDKAKNYSGQWRIRVSKHLHAVLALKAKEEGVSLNMLAATLLAEEIGNKSASILHEGILGNINLMKMEIQK